MSSIKVLEVQDNGLASLLDATPARVGAAPASHSHDASAIVSGVIDPARLPPSGGVIVASGDITSLTAGQQAEIVEGTEVVLTSSGMSYIYSGSGSKTDLASYILKPVVVGWNSVTGKPDSVTAIGALTAAADFIAYYTGAATAALTALTAFGRSLIGAVDAAAARTLLACLPTSNPNATGYVRVSSKPSMEVSALDTAGWFGYAGKNTAGGYIGYYALSDGSLRLAAAATKTVRIGNGAGYSAIVIDDSGLTVPQLAGTGVRAVAADSSGKLVASAGPGEVMVFSDFGRTGSGTDWQSAFADNAVAALKLASNSVENGTRIRIEQEIDLPNDSGAQYQVALGPYLIPGGTGPVSPRYVDAISMADGKSGAGRLEIVIEFLGSGASMTAYVTSTQYRRGSTPFQPIIYTGSMPFDATLDRWIDVQFNPNSVAGSSYVIRRNRIFRLNP